MAPMHRSPKVNQGSYTRDHLAQEIPIVLKPQYLRWRSTGPSDGRISSLDPQASLEWLHKYNSFGFPVRRVSRCTLTVVFCYRAVSV